MKKYLFIGFIAFILFAYWAGTRVEKQRCNTKIAELNSQSTQIVLKNIEVANAKTFNTGVRDIRRILREQYSIAE